MRPSKQPALGGILEVSMRIPETDHHPRTDPASVRSNYIQFSPEVTGRLINIPVKDNAFVHAGSVLFAIDPQTYQDALDQVSTWPRTS
jgi:multidrug efflux system membrane fusion protein